METKSVADWRISGLRIDGLIHLIKKQLIQVAFLIR